jgi:CheY-like chemotaxis protein
MPDYDTAASLDIALPLIFIVDDDVRILRLASHILSKSMYKVHCVSSAEAALRWLESYTPDIILMDINLPGKDGFGILEDIKNYNNLKNTKIVAFTSLARPGDMARFIKAGFDFYLAKPFSKEGLLTFIKDMSAKVLLNIQTL